MGSRAGVLKVAAKRVGLSLEDYTEKISSGLKWCTGCKAWHETISFRFDETRGDALAATCEDYRKTRRAGKARNVPRDAVKDRARGIINARVKRGKLPHPNSVPCMDCAHIGPDIRHEYDHYLGHDEINKSKVQCVCARCHRRREYLRRGQAT